MRTSSSKPLRTVASLLVCGTTALAFANEAGSLVVANQTGFQTNGSTTIERPYSLDFPPPAGKYRHYLDFLADRLAFIPDYTNPALYPIVTLIDAGLDNGDPSAPELDEFYRRGHKANPSRYAFSFDHSWRSPSVPSPADGYTTRFGDSITTLGVRDRFCILNVNNQQHGSATAIAIIGHPRTDASGIVIEDDSSPLPADYTMPSDSTLDPVSNTTGHRRGQGTSPYGRMACGGVGTMILNWPAGMCNSHGIDPFRPEDLTRVVGEIHRRVYWTDHGPADFASNPFRPEHESVPTSQTAITNNSMAIVPTVAPASPTTGGTDSGYGSFHYDTIARTYDRLTRDSRPRQWHPADDGRCETLFIAAAGGDRRDAPLEAKRQEDAIWVPGLAKNVLTVGSSEVWNDFPGEPSADPLAGNGGSSNNIWLDGTSSRAGSPRTIDARIKPDIVVPSSGVWMRLLAVPRQPPAISDPARYHTASGGSGAPPNVSGIAQLSAVFLKHQYGRDTASPALLKSYIINTATMISGANTGKYDPADPASQDRPAPIPNPYQGFGRVNLDLALDKAARFLVDQDVVFTDQLSVPDRVLYNGYVDSGDKPVRVTLAWTDAIIEESRPRWQELVNNLDLLVAVHPPSAPTRLYMGNNFNISGDMQHSAPIAYPALASFNYQDPWTYTLPGDTQGDMAANGLKDNANNVECVFLPSGLPIGTRVQVSVRNAFLGADALDPFVSTPAPVKRQDFALVAYNFTSAGNTRFTSVADWMLFE